MITETLWAMEPTALRAFLDQLARFELADAAARRSSMADLLSDAPAKRYEVDDQGVATLRLHGPILRNEVEWLKWWGFAHVGATEARQDVADMLADPSVRSITLDIDSPGGTVPGVADLADAIHAATKPVHAVAADLAASAAYWIGAQADTFEVGQTALIGSIGVYRVMIDTSRMAEADGVKVHVLASAPLKGAGVSGAVVTDAQLADAQRIVDGLADHFNAAVTRGRKLSGPALARVATGQVWIGKDAVAMGLADMVSGQAAPQQTAGIAPQGRVATMADQAKAAGDLAQAQKEALEAAHAQIAALKIQAEEARAAAAAVKAQAQLDRAAAVMTANASRITPAMQPHMTRIAAAYGDDLDGFAAFVSSLPVATHAAPMGSAPAEPAPVAAAPQIIVTDEDRRASAMTGVPAERIAARRMAADGGVR